MSIRFTDLLVNFIINIGKENVLNNSISSNVVRLSKIWNKSLTKFLGLVLPKYIFQTKIKYWKNKYSKVSIYNIGIL